MTILSAASPHLPTVLPPEPPARQNANFAFDSLLPALDAVADFGCVSGQFTFSHSIQP